MEKIDQETLRGWLSDPELYLMDVRAPAEWDASAVKIAHAVRFDPTQLSPDSAKDIPRDKKIVLYCS